MFANPHGNLKAAFPLRIGIGLILIGRTFYLGWGISELRFYSQ